MIRHFGPECQNFWADLRPASRFSQHAGFVSFNFRDENRPFGGRASRGELSQDLVSKIDC